MTKRYMSERERGGGGGNDMREVEETEVEMKKCKVGKIERKIGRGRGNIDDLQCFL